MRIIHMLVVTLLAAIFVIPGYMQLFGAEDLSLEERLGTCQRCANMAERLGDEVLAQEPHTFACSDCHHPHLAREPEDWRHTCQTEDCHPRAWTETVYHRISNSAIFVQCLECHTVHDWKQNGKDCLSCHDPESMESVETGFSDPFDHDIHTSFDCSTCHETVNTHSRATVRKLKDCQGCHHESTNQDCASCHDQPVARTLRATMQLSQDTPPRNRDLAFDHTTHDMLECDTCHNAGPLQTPEVSCASCHDEHHYDGATCASCHETPPPQAHDRSVHFQSCEQSGCHSSPVPFSWNTRNCVICHTDKDEHYSNDNCAWCHSPGKD